MGRGVKIGDIRSAFNNYRRVSWVEGDDTCALIGFRILFLYLRKTVRRRCERGMVGMVAVRDEFGSRMVIVWASFR
jgi:hypothetical protein